MSQESARGRHLAVKCILSEPLIFQIDRLKTPIGEMLIVLDREENLRAVDWADYEGRMLRLLRIQCGRSG
jgi:methylated-DNA-[protein]-cysteine S-methyltransferase